MATWQEREREGRARRRKAREQEKLWVSVFTTIFIVVLLAGILWLRHSGPCWIFPLAEAPTRCLPGSR